MQPLLMTASPATTQQQLRRSQLEQMMALPPTAAGKHAPSAHLSTLQREVSKKGCPASLRRMSAADPLLLGSTESTVLMRGSMWAYTLHM